MKALLPRKHLPGIILFAAVLLLLFLLIIRTPVAASDTVKTIYFYYGQGCAHCAKVESYFERTNAYAKYQIEKREVYFDNKNAAAYTAAMDNLGIPINEQGVPTVIIGDKAITGDEPIISDFVATADAYIKGEVATDSTGDEPKAQKSDRKNLSTWVIVSAAAVDAINPCAFAVLLVLLSTVLSQKQSRRRVIASGTVFSLVIFASYFMMGLGLYKALTIGGVTSIFTTVVGILAIALGLFNLKDWLWYGKTAPMEVPMSWRPRMLGIIKRVTSPAGAGVAALLVSLFLLPCTSGPYIVVLGLLVNNPLDAQLLWYLVLYNFVFILPMLFITWLVAFGLSTETLSRLREKHVAKLHLVAGLILIALGVFVLVT